jgi:hypothetical protein
MENPEILAECDFFGDGSSKGLWEFNGSTSDACGTNDFIFEGYPAYALGIVDLSKSAKITENNYLVSPNPLSGTTGNFSYSVWIKREVSKINYESIISEYLSTETNRTILGINANTLQIFYGSEGWADTNFEIEIDNWYHIVLSSDNTSNLTNIYINNQKIHTLP